MSRRRAARRAVLQALYRDEFYPESLFEKEVEKFLLFLQDKNKGPESQLDTSFAKQLLNGIKEKREEIDKIIKKEAKNWSLDRISLVDLNILRMGVFEILFSDQVPAIAALNEALDLAKEFGQENSASFINGILDQVLKTTRAEERGDDKGEMKNV